MDSILDSTKKVLGIAEDYTAFDPDVIIHINSAMSVLDQLGVGPEGGLLVQDKMVTWDALGVPQNQLMLIQSYVYLKARLGFDPPTTSFLLEAVKEQIREHEWRLSAIREGIEHPYVEEEKEVEV